jgi:[ribosomal protein S5]-alanine N-acetyltransferase
MTQTILMIGTAKKVMQLVNPDAVLDTARLWLDPLRKSHAAVLFPLLQDARIYRYMPQDPPESLAALEERYRNLESRLSPAGDEAWLNWVVRLKSSSQFAGWVEATVLSDGTAMLAYVFFPDFWGCGYAAEACRRVLQVLFYDYAVSAVLAEVDTRNTASMRLLESLNFSRTGYRQGADFFKGSSSDEYTYRLPAG